MVSTAYATAIAAIFLSSSVLSEEVAKKKHRDRAFYTVAGLLLGPLALLAMLSPAPGAAAVPRVKRERVVRVVEDVDCPECGKRVPARAMNCPFCQAEMGAPLWDKLAEVQPPYIEVQPRRQPRRRTRAAADVPMAEPVSLLELEAPRIAADPSEPVSLIEMEAERAPFPSEPVSLLELD